MTTTKRTPEIERKFLALLVENGGSIAGACKEIGITRFVIHSWRQADEDFDRRFQLARALSSEAMRDEAIRRAMDGSDTLLKFELQARYPDLYRKRLEITPPAGINGGKVIDVLATAEQAADVLLIEKKDTATDGAAVSEAPAQIGEAVTAEHVPADCGQSSHAIDHRAPSESGERSIDPQLPVAS